MWNNLAPQQQQFLMQMLMGNWGGMMQQGQGNPLMAGGAQMQPASGQGWPMWTGGNWSNWFNNGQQLPAGSNGIAGAYLGGNPQQLLPMQPQSLPQGSNGIAGVYFGGNPQQTTPLPMQPQTPMPQMPTPGDPSSVDPASNPQQFIYDKTMAQLQPWMQNQLPPGYGQDGGGPSYSPYAMPGTPQYNPNG